MSDSTPNPIPSGSLTHHSKGTAKIGITKCLDLAMAILLHTDSYPSHEDDDHAISERHKARNQTLEEIISNAQSVSNTFVQNYSGQFAVKRQILYSLAQRAYFDYCQFIALVSKYLVLVDVLEEIETRDPTPARFARQTFSYACSAINAAAAEADVWLEPDEEPDIVGSDSENEQSDPDDDQTLQATVLERYIDFLSSEPGSEFADLNREKIRCWLLVESVRSSDITGAVRFLWQAAEYAQVIMEGVCDMVVPQSNDTRQTASQARLDQLETILLAVADQFNQALILLAQTNQNRGFTELAKAIHVLAVDIE